MSEGTCICRGCLATEVNLYNIHGFKGLADTYANLMGDTVIMDEVPPYVCGVCTRLLHKFKVYKDTCHKSLQILRTLQLYNKLSPDKINNVEQIEFLNLKLSVTQTNSFEPINKKLVISPIEYVDIQGACTNVLESIDSQNPIDDTRLEFEVKKEDSDLSTYHHITTIKIEHCNDDEGLNNDSDESMIKTDDEDEDIEIPVIVKPEKRLRQRKIYIRDTKDTGVIDTAVTTKRITSVKLSEKTKVAKKDRVMEDCKESENYLNSKLFFENHPTCKPTKKMIKKRIELLDEFSKKYNMEIKYLTKEEQKREVEALKEQFKHMNYQCQICYRGFSLEHAYTTHMLAHDPAAGEFACEICGLRYREHRLMSRHMTIHSDHFTCRACGKVIKYRNAAKEHFARHSGATYSCEECGATYKKAGNYQEHLRKIHQSKVASCLICRKAFTGEAGVIVHMAKKHKQAVQCNSCKLYFENTTALAKHLEDSANGACTPEIRPCMKCGKGFASEAELSAHEVLHSERYQCTKCSKCYPSSHTLYNHLATVHSEADRTHAAVKASRSKAIKDKEYVCETCGKAFAYRALLKYHMRLHTGEKPHQCSVCSKTFRLKFALKSHMLMHKDERPYSCELCPKTFRQFTHRVSHMRTHTLEKPFECEICHKTFNLKSNMQVHARTVHEGLPPRRRKRDR